MPARRLRRGRHKAPSQSFPQGGWRTKVARTHSTSMVRGGHGRCQGWFPPGSIRRTRASSGAGQGDAAGPGPPQPSEGLVPFVEISRRPAAALCSAVLHFAATLDLRGRRGPTTFRAFIHSIPWRLARPIVAANVNGTRIGMTPSSRASSPGPLRLGQPCPDAYVQGRRVVTPVEKRPRERQWPGSSSTFRSSDPGRRTPD
jgi:hypothetical protein